jgi:type I restriction enzyme S subunit
VSWSTVELGDVAAFVRGVTFKPENVAPPDGDGTVACMRTKNVQEQLDTTDLWGIPRSLIKRSEQYLMAGDTLVSSANSWNLVGKCCWVPELNAPATFGGFVSVLRADDEQLEPRYLFRWFSSPMVQQLLRSFGRKTTSISNLDLAQCRKLSIPLPPIDEQRRIARVLDSADALRAKRGVTCHLLRGLRGAALASVIARSDRAEERPLGSLADVQGGLQVMKARASRPREVPYLRVANVHRGRLDLSVVKSLRVTDAEERRCALRINDLLVVEGHGNAAEIGRAARWDGSIPACVHQNHLIRARCDPDILLPMFAEAYINSSTGRRHLLRAAKTTSGLNTITVGDVRKVPIVVPPMALQHAFAQSVAAIEKAERRASRHLATLDALFASLEHRAFTGAL